MASQSPFRDPQARDGEKATYTGGVGRQDFASGSMTLAADEGSYTFTLNADVVGKINYVATTVFRREDGVIRVDSTSIETSHQGKVTARDEAWFNDVKTLQWGGEILAYPEDIVPILAVPFALRSSLHSGVKRTVSLWLANTVHWEVFWKVEKLETIRVPAGEFRAWRVRLRPHFEHVAGPLDRIIALLLPPFILHFQEEAPNALLRFEFPTGPFPWNPKAIVEATSIG